MVQAARAQPALGNLKAAALPENHGVARHAHRVEEQLRVAVGRVVKPKHGQRPAAAGRGQVSRAHGWEAAAAAGGRASWVLLAVQHAPPALTQPAGSCSGCTGGQRQLRGCPADLTTVMPGVLMGTRTIDCWACVGACVRWVCGGGCVGV